MQKAKILIVEDEMKMSDSLSRGLSKYGFDSLVLKDGLLARSFDFESPEGKSVALVILDWGLPLIDGIEVLRFWRKSNSRASKIPVLMFTARNSVIDRVNGLDFGADDYMSKFFEWEELIARINALLRRGVVSKTSALAGVKVGGVEFNEDEKEFRENGKLVSLTQKEFLILEFFFNHPNKLITKAVLLSKLWTDEPDSNVIEKHIKSIRKKLIYDPITTHRGFGYRLRVSNSTNASEGPRTESQK
jgi:DNA-binding response OmpR family regulator